VCTVYRALPGVGDKRGLIDAGDCNDGPVHLLWVEERKESPYCFLTVIFITVNTGLNHQAWALEFSVENLELEPNLLPVHINAEVNAPICRASWFDDSISEFICLVLRLITGRRCNN